MVKIDKIKNLILITLLAAMFSGCTVQTSPEDIIKTPRLNEVDRRIEELIRRNIPENAKFESVKSEEGLSTVKMIDIDGDGIEEVLVTYALEAEKEPLHLLIFRKNNDSYSFVNDLPIRGTEFDKIEIKEISSNGKKDLVISTIENNSKVLTLYSLKDEIKKVFEIGYSAYILDDIDGDKNTDIVIFKSSNQELTSDYYIYNREDSQVKFVNETTNHINIENFKPAIIKNIEKNRKGIIVEGSDINDKVRYNLVYGINKDGKLENLIKDTTEEGAPVVGLTSINNRDFTINDIDEDNVIEIPRPHLMSPKDRTANGDRYLYYTDWLKFKDNKFISVVRNIYLEGSRVYFEYPKNWKDENIIGELSKKNNSVEYKFSKIDDSNKKNLLMTIVKTDSNMSKEYKFIKEDDKEKYYIKSEKAENELLKGLYISEDSVIKSFKIQK